MRKTHNLNSQSQYWQITRGTRALAEWRNMYLSTISSDKIISIVINIIIAHWALEVAFSSVSPRRSKKTTVFE